jgi:putative transposase
MAPGTRRLTGDVDAIIEKAISTTYKTRERPRLNALHRHIRHDCLAAGLKPPSMKALRARVTARRLKEVVRAREGRDTARNRFTPAIGGLQTSAPLDLVQVDHTLVDVHLVDEILRQPLGRPWLTLVLDVHTRCVLGMLLTLDPPSATSVALALSHAVLPKSAWLAELGVDLPWPMLGLPKTFHSDNAKEFHSKALIRGCAQHGIQIDYRARGSPHHGGHIERLMGTLMRRLHALPGTAFSSIAERGNYPSEERASLTLRELERFLALEVVGLYHNEVHNGLGLSPTAAWADGIACGWQPREPVDPKRFALDFLPFAERAVGREGLRLFNIHYFDGALTALIGTRTQLRIRYDPRDLTAVFAEMPDGTYLRVPYADLGRPPISLWEHRAAVRRLRAEGRKSVDEPAIFAAIDAQRRTVSEAYVKAKAARRAVARVVEAQRVPITREAIRKAVPADIPEPPIVGEEGRSRVPEPTEEDIVASEFWS